MATLQWLVYTSPDEPPKIRVGSSDNPKHRAAYRFWWKKYEEIERQQQQRGIDDDDENTPTNTACEGG